MTLVDKALWVIERNSDRNLTLGAIADACGVSRSHLASAFGGATGWPVMKYLRRRRLSIAAEALAGGAMDILALALETGYGSHEAFTRAFGDAFGVTPEQVRERGSIDGITLIHPAGMQRRSETSLAAPRIVDVGTIRAVGLARRHTFDSVIGIPIQWQAFMARGDRIPDQLDVMPLGFVLPADEAESFEYVCAVEVATISTFPSGLIAIDLPPRRYAVFEHVAHVSTIFDSYVTIWDRVLPGHGWIQAEAPIVERHLPAFDPSTGEGGVAIWIPLAEPLIPPTRG